MADPARVTKGTQLVLSTGAPEVRVTKGSILVLWSLETIATPARSTKACILVLNRPVERRSQCQPVVG